MMKGKLIQYACTVVLTIPCFQAAFTFVWPSYAIPALQSDRSPLGYKISEREAGLISSCTMLSPMIVTMFAGTLADVFGRKKISVACGFIILSSWILVLTAKSASQILIARLICGLAFGCNIIVVIMYIGELCQTSTRATATVIITFLFSIGALASYSLGWVCSYETVCYFCITLSVIYIIFMFALVKESPVFLVGKGREKEALHCLAFYRGASVVTEHVLGELSYMRSQHNQNKQNHPIEENVPQYETEKLTEEKTSLPQEETSGWKLLFASTSSRRALISMVSIMVLTVYMGMVSVQVYAAQLFTKMAPNISPDLCSVILALVLVASSCVGTFTMDLFKRRSLMICSTLMSSWCMAVLGSLLRWSWASDWAVTLVVVIYCFSYQVGPNSLPFVLTSETFGPQTRGVASQVVVTSMFLSNFLLLILFGPVEDQIGLDGTFFLFSIIGFVTVIFTYFTMKETKGIPLDEIQKMYEKGFLYREK